MKVGIFGGTFDPPHIAHSIIAERVLEEFGLDQIVWVPAFDPPHKSLHQLSSFTHRVAMVDAAVSNHFSFQVSEIESTLDCPTYTIRMLRALRKQFSHAKRYLILGGDSLNHFHTWMEPEAIMEHVDLIVYPRAGHLIEEMDLPPYLSDQIHYIQAPMMSLSGEHVRTCLSEEKSIRYLVLESVRDYIVHHQIYH